MAHLPNPPTENRLEPPVLLLSVVTPVRDGGELLAACLAAMRENSRPPDEIFVVDDGSQDGSADLAHRAGAQVLHTEGVGPGLARNVGATEANGDILVFVDADVILRPDALARIERFFVENPEYAALFGSYDDAPLAKNAASLYKNLLHHHVHQNGGREATTFWAGLGAIRRNAFWKAGGFSSAYLKPSIEDIELGHRLRLAGNRIALCPEIQGTHGKHWTLWNLWKTDIFRRALPWSLLLATTGKDSKVLNLNTAGRVGAGLAWGIVLNGGIAPFWTPALWLCVVCVLAFLAQQRVFFRLLWRRGGAIALGAGVLLHLFYFLYSSLIFVSTLVWFRLTRKRREMRSSGGERA